MIALLAKRANDQRGDNTVSNHEQQQGLGQWPNAPLALVLAQIRFDVEIDTEYRDVAERIRAAMGDRFEATKKLRQLTYTLGGADMNGTPVPSEEEVGLELRSDDDRNSLRLQDGAMTFTTSHYRDSPHFLADWRAMLEGLCPAGGVKVQRLGMRYVDFIIPANGKEPEDYFSDGFSRSPTPFSGKKAEAAFLSYDYPMDDAGMMRIQYGRGFAPPSLSPDLQGLVQPPPPLVERYDTGPSAVLDIDHWRLPSRRMKTEEIAAEFQRLRDDIARAFHCIIADEARNEWTGKPA